MSLVVKEKYQLTLLPHTQPGKETQVIWLADVRGKAAVTAIGPWGGELDGLWD